MVAGECSIMEGIVVFLDEVQKGKAKKKANKAANDDDNRENKDPEKDKTVTSVRPKLSSNTY